MYPPSKWGLAGLMFNVGNALDAMRSPFRTPQTNPGAAPTTLFHYPPIPPKIKGFD